LDICRNIFILLLYAMYKALKIQEIDKNIITHEIDRLKMMHYSIKNRGLNPDGSNFANNKTED